MGNIGSGEGARQTEDLSVMLEEAVKKAIDDAAPALADKVAKAALKNMKNKLHLAMRGSDFLRLATEEDLRGELSRRQEADDDTEFVSKSFAEELKKRNPRVCEKWLPT
uniref:Uncharacterized protein n=1 Tax=Lotharella globosa TaxID=91324 RepID=A0A6V3K3H5_9EUKA|mmetsp:Transcript_15131/g.30612  ORF Transcript_15131/g.30612 Transcript_15131/m.30612 type:complete len:109 (+) Transcript_15131:1394-1720(+)